MLDNEFCGMMVCMVIKFRGLASECVNKVCEQSLNKSNQNTLQTIRCHFTKQNTLILGSEKSVGVFVALMYTKTDERKMPISPAGVATISSS
jgi:hypothetical protein